MGINENDVAILIPTYRRADMIGGAVESALATGAGEIVVSDNCSDDGTKEIITRYQDPRLRVLYQRENLGIWGNHLSLLQNTKKPWIKFLHADDRIAADGLGTMCAAVGETTGIVSVLPIFDDLASGERKTEFFLSGARYWQSDEYMERLLTVGNELGSPSNTLFRSDTLEHCPEAWQNDLFCDLIANVIAASRGNVVLLPSGPIIVGCHDGQVTVTSSLEVSLKRLRNTLEYFNKQENLRIRTFSRVFAFVEGIGTLRSAMGLMKRRKKFWYREFIRDVQGIFWCSGISYSVCHPKRIYGMMAWKYGRRIGKNLDRGL